VAAAEELREGKFPVHTFGLMFFALVRDALDAIPDFRRNQRLLAALIGGAIEIEAAGVDAFAQDLVQR